MIIEIRSRGCAIIWATEARDIRDAVGKAVQEGVCLKHALLPGAYLVGVRAPGINLAGAFLPGASFACAQLRGADLSDANMRGCDLRDCDLSQCDLSHSDLRGADVRRADLSGARIEGADFQGATLCGAKGLDRRRVTPLMLLLDQPGPIRLYKLVKDDYSSPFFYVPGCPLTYRPGTSVSVIVTNTDPDEQCGVGINVCTLDWALSKWVPGMRVVLVEFVAADIACIPTASDGKIRLHRCRVVSELDTSTLGLGPGGLT